MPPKKCSACDKVPSKYGSKIGSNPKPTNKKRSLTAAENDLFKKHSGHSAKHITHMKAFLRAGKGCWLDAHVSATKAVGK